MLRQFRVAASPVEWRDASDRMSLRSMVPGVVVRRLWMSYGVRSCRSTGVQVLTPRSRL